MEPEETRPIEPPGPEAALPAGASPAEAEATAAQPSSPAGVAAAWEAPPQAPAEPLVSAAAPDSVPSSPQPGSGYAAAAMPPAEGAPPLETTAAHAVEPLPDLPELPTVTPVPPPAGFASLEREAGPREQTEPEVHPAGPNWMLAFVCAWAGLTALNEAWAVLVPIGIKAQLLRNTAFLGYALLGFGLILFAVEALRWGARRREGGGLMAVVLPALMTLAGVVALVMSHDPGRRI